MRWWQVCGRWSVAGPFLGAIEKRRIVSIHGKLLMNLRLWIASTDIPCP